MAIQSYGYPELLASGADFARMAYGFGRQYVAPFESHCRPTISQTGTRRISISTGYLAGKHIVDFNDAIVNIDLPQASGASQWFLIGLKRWVATGVPAAPFRSEFGYIAGSALKAIPTYPQVPGTNDFQPIALVRIVSTATIPADIVDLRGIAEEPGIYTIYDDMAMEVIARPGATAYNAVTGATYRHVYIENKSRSWQRVYDTPMGERPRFVVRRNGGYPGWNGTGRHHSPNQFQKQGDADTHFAWNNAGGNTADGGFIVFKTAGVYAIQARTYLDGGGAAYYANLSFEGDYLGVTALAGQGCVNGWSDLFIAEESWLPAGARIGLRQYTNRAINTRDWAMWASRISD